MSDSTNAAKATDILVGTQDAWVDVQDDFKKANKGDLPEIGVAVQVSSMAVAFAQVRATLAVADQLERVADVLERINGSTVYTDRDGDTRLALADQA